MSTSELACTYAALILHDDGISITADKIATLVKAAGVKVDSYWPILFAKLASKRNIDDLILNVANSASAAAPAAPPMPSPADAPLLASAPSVDAKNEVAVHEESEDDLMFSLFD